MTGAVDARWSAETARSWNESSRLDRVGERVAAVGVGLLIVTGFASSYTTLRDLAVEDGGFSPWLAPVVPLSFDLGIVVLSLKVVLAARAGRDARVLRVLVLLLSAATVAANGAASANMVGRLLHAVPPAMFVVCFETLAASARHDAHARLTATRHDTPAGDQLPALTRARWLLAPRQTWCIWRARVLGTDLRGRSTVALQTPAPAPAMPVAPGVFPLGDRVAKTAAFPSSTDAPHGSLAGDQPAPPVEGTEPPQLTAPIEHSAPVSADTEAAGQHDRLAVAVNALRADPAMTAVALAEHLGCTGHPVSVRTAQRVRHQAEHHLVSRPQDRDALSATGEHEGRSR